jgi:type IV pilus assembly protein PilB
MQVPVDENGLVNGVDPAENPTQFSAKKLDLADWLLVWGHVTHAQIDLANREAKRKSQSLGQTLSTLGFVEPRILSNYIAQRSESENIDVRKVIVPAGVRDLIPREAAMRYLALPIRLDGEKLVVALGNALDLTAADAIEQLVRRPVEIVASTEGDVREAINRTYTQESHLDETIDEILAMDTAALAAASETDAPMIRLVEQMLLFAISNGVSDIHIHPEEKILRIRMRRDGILDEGILVPREIQNAITARLKILGDMDITETRLPQAGRYNFDAGAKPVDFRFSSLPTAFGESIVLRILDRSSLNLDLNTLGFQPTVEREFLNLLERPHGVILVTGPTGSGKTTTLYAALSKLRGDQKSIFTLEDPIEFHIPLVRQTQVSEKIGLTFAAGLRTLLRQDPDIILVGETRDQETAELMVRAALTGHLVLSTLHTNDALGAIPRLIDLGIPPYMLPACLLGLQSQRLVRVLCPSCREPHPNAEEMLGTVEAPLPEGCEPKLWKAVGCDKCKRSGYRGRTCIVEYVPMDDDFYTQILKGNDPIAFRRIAAEKGHYNMFQDGLIKATQGVTTLEEIYRVTSTG